MNERTIDYEKVSTEYDKVRSSTPEMIRHLLEGMPQAGMQLALDIGCGTANNTLPLIESSGARGVGVDLSLGMLKRACMKTVRIPFVQSDAGNLPFKSEIFDFIFMTEVIHHIQAPEHVVEEIFRVLRVGGRVCIVTQSHAQIEQRMTSRFFPETVQIDKERYPSIAQLEKWLVDCGFSNVEALSYKFRPVQIGEGFLETVRSKGYSMLHKISPQAYEKGLLELQKALDDGERLDHATGYTFVWAIK